MVECFVFLRPLGLRLAKIYAEVIGFGMGSDAYHMTAPNVDGPKRSMKAALRDAQINPEEGGS